MKPIGYIKKKKGEVILYRCTKCNEEHTNIIADDDNIEKYIDLDYEKFGNITILGKFCYNNKVRLR